jgi:hypothetical protein
MIEEAKARSRLAKERASPGDEKAYTNVIVIVNREKRDLEKMRRQSIFGRHFWFT